MARRPSAICYLTLLTLASLASGGCESFLPFFRPRPKVIVDANPSFNTVAHIVNQNSARVVSLQSNNASISSSQMPGSLSANLAMRRDRRFRLKADFALSGTEVDLGSNDELFWVWIRRGNPKALYFCHHQDFHRSSAQAIMPVQPEWLIEAFGLASFDLNGNYQGPEPVGQGRLRITSLVQTPRGPMTKATVIDAQYGDILEQHLYDANSQLLASALTSNHKKYTLQANGDAPDIYLPHRVELVFPQTNMTLTIDVGSFEINGISDGPSPMWEMPKIDGYPLVNLADPNLQLSTPMGVTQGSVPGATQSGTQWNGNPQSTGQPYGVQYGSGVAPASYPGAASQYAPSSHSGAAYPANPNPGFATSSASDSFGPAESRRETLVSPPPRYGESGAPRFR